VEPDSPLTLYLQRIDPMAVVRMVSRRPEIGEEWTWLALSST
jgi:hypothetical protein